MSLGADNKKCAQALIDAMRDRLNQETPPAGDNVNQDSVKKNFLALGQGIYTILTVDAQVDTSGDPSFWNWISGLSAWAVAMETWQQQVKSAFNAWTPANPGDTTFKNAVLAIADPPAPPVAAPVNVVGVIK